VPGPEDARARALGRSPLVTSRNNSDKIDWSKYDSPLREPRKYVQKCGTGSLALMFEPGSVAFTALSCGSWSCPTCRKQNAARQLDRLRRGMESRADHRRTFVTLTLNPADFGAKPRGVAYWDANGNRTIKSKAQRRTTLWSEPTARQFQAACEAMSREWNKLNDRLRRFCEYRELPRVDYFRVVELHRNLWPHYHVLLEHPELESVDLAKPLKGWKLGRTDAREISLDDAVGELAPYLVATERKGGGSKAYQFAATALPKNFRLYSASRDFLAEPTELGRPVEHSFPVAGHFTTHHQTAASWGADARIVLHAPEPPEKAHKPPSSSLLTGDGATRYYTELLGSQPVHLDAQACAYLTASSDQEAEQASAHG
jgi:hypothetical protein